MFSLNRLRCWLAQFAVARDNQGHARAARQLDFGDSKNGGPMDTRIVGTTMPVLEVTLELGETIVAEPGEMSWMTSSITLNTSTQLGGAKGVFGVLKRAMGGGGPFMTEFSAQGSPGMVAFATKVPGEILP